MRYAVLLLVFLGLQLHVFSSHHSRNEGGDIQFTHIDSGRYDIYITYYVRCNGVGISAPTLLVSGGSNNLNVSTSLQSKTNITSDAIGCAVTTIDSNYSTLNANDLIEKWVFKGTVDLVVDTSVCSWLIKTPSLIGTRDNYTGSSSQSWFIYANLWRCHGDFSSPAFSNPLLICQA